MPSSDPKVRVYEDLAEWEHQNGTPQARDRFLILAADAALTAGLTEEAERFRSRLLEYNPHHLLRPYPSLKDAMKSSDVYSYIADLRGNYPLGESEQLLASLTGKKPVDGLPPLPEMPPPPEPLRDDYGAPAKATMLAVANRDAEAAELAARKMLRPRPGAAADVETDTIEEGDPEPVSPVSVWLSDALFVMMFVAGVALAVYTFARPFIPVADGVLR